MNNKSDKNIFVKRNELVSLKGNTLSIKARKMLDYICKIGFDVYKQKMDEEGIFSISIKELKEIAEMHFKSDHSELLEELKILSKIEVETWDDRYYSQFPILAGFKIQDKDGIVEIALSPFLLRETFKDKDDEPYYHYCNLMEYKGLRSKYSKIILDLHTRYKPLPIPKMNMKKFKDLLQYPEKYKNNDIKRFVLEQAQRELLEKNNLKIDWEIEKLGRKWGYITILAIPIEDSVTAKIDDKVIEISENLNKAIEKAKKNRFIEFLLTEKNIIKLISKFTNEEQLIKGLNHAYKEIKQEIKHLSYLIKAIETGAGKQEIKIKVAGNIPVPKEEVEVVKVVETTGEGKKKEVEEENEAYRNFLKMSEEAQQEVEKIVYKEYVKECGQDTKIQKLAFRASKRKLIIDFLETRYNFRKETNKYYDEIEKKAPKEEVVKVKPKREMTQNQYDCLFQIYLSNIKLTMNRENRENREIDVEEERKKFDLANKDSITIIKKEITREELLNKFNELNFNYSLEELEEAFKLIDTIYTNQELLDTINSTNRELLDSIVESMRKIKAG